MLRRLIETELRATIASSPVTLVHGARQTGKTTLVQALCSASGRGAWRYVTLDDAFARDEAERDPDGFIDGLGDRAVIDEVQLVPRLFRSIKRNVDKNRRPGRFVLSGSANVLALPKLGDSLAGRMQIVRVWPMAQVELDGLEKGWVNPVDEWFGARFDAGARDAGTRGRGGVGRRSVWSRLVRGGFPEPAQMAVSRRGGWFNGYLSTMMQRDVREIANIEGLTDVPRIVQILAARSGGLFNLASLSRDTGLAQTTLKRYVAMLEATFLAVPLLPWHTNVGQRLMKSPKMLLGDTGLACHLARADESRLKQDDLLRGGMLETFVGLELMKLAAASRSKPGVHHLRSLRGQEVDIVLEGPGGKLVGVEVKSAATVTSDDFRGLRWMQDEVGEKFVRGVVLYAGDEVVVGNKNTVALPMGWLWR